MKKILIVVALAAASTGCVFARQPLPFSALGAPVLVTFTNGESGSAFYLSASNHVYVATARHVLFDKNGKLHANSVTLQSLQYGSTTNDVVMRFDLAALQAAGEIRAHPTHDVAIVRFGNQLTNGKIAYDRKFCDPIKYPEGGITFIGTEFTRRLEEVYVGSDVFVFGYPSSVGLRASPKFDYTRPLLRKGIVAGVYHQTKTIILDSSVYFGNSGGPVMEVEYPDGIGASPRFKVIGVVSEMIPFLDVWENKRFGYSTGNLSNSGYSVVEPVDFILELVW